MERLRLLSLHIGLLRGDPCQQRLTTRQTLSGPVLLAIVVLEHRWCSWRQNHPGLFGRSENVYVRRQVVRFVERSDADKSYGRPCARVVAPHGDAAVRAAGDLLALTTLRRCVDNLRLGAEQRDSVGFDHRVQGKGRTRLSLAPTAVATVNE
jgi:hypothetical protein